MVLKFFLLAIAFFFISCSVPERDNPYDPDGNNYQGPRPSSSSSSVVPIVPSSSSSALVVPPPPSSSSFVVAIPSSSSVPPQSSIIPGPSVPYEGETYETVVIGTQTWMARNLNYAVAGSRCYGDNSGGDSQNRCATYGRLYNWATAMDLAASCNTSSCASQVNTKHRGICPSGWHIPSDAEWDVLENYAGGYSTAGTKLKATSGWGDNDNGTDKFGFSALPGGAGTSGGRFYDVGNLGGWWSSSENKSNLVYYRYIYSSLENVGYDDSDKGALFSVRCVMD